LGCARAVTCERERAAAGAEKFGTEPPPRGARAPEEAGAGVGAEVARAETQPM